MAKSFTLLCCFVLVASFSVWAQDGAVDAAFDPGTGPALPNPNGHVPSVRSIALQQDGKVVIAGEFTLVDNVTRLGLARLNTNGDLDPSFVPDLDPTVVYKGSGLRTAVQLDGKILYYASVYDGYDDQRLIRLNPDGSRDASFHLGVPITGLNELLVLPDGKIIIPAFLGSADNYQLLRLNTDGNVDATFNVDLGGTVYSLATQPDGKVLLAGSLGSVNGVSVNKVARVNPDGSVDTSFQTQLGALSANSIVVQPDGKILVGGTNYLINGQTYYGIVRLNPDGSLDPGFVPYSKSDLINVVSEHGVALQPDGKIIVTTVYKTVRLNTDGSLDGTFTPPNTANATSSQNFNANTMARDVTGGIYLGGSFFAVNGATRQNIVRINSAAPIGAVPQVTSAAMATGTTGNTFAFQITATSTPLSYAVSGLPDGLTFDRTTGLVTGTPALPGTFNLVVAATNAVGTGSAPLTLTIAPTATVAIPVITSAAGAYGQSNVAFSYQIAATQSPIAFSASGLPDGLYVGTHTGLIAGTPTETGIFSVTVGATNAGGSGTAVLSLMVSVDPPPAPVVTSATTASGQVGHAFTYLITATNYPVSYGASGLPAGLTVDRATGLIAGTPSVPGTFNVALFAANSVTASLISALTITILPAPPEITSATSTNTVADQFFSYQITATNDPTSYAVSTLPAGLSYDATSGLISGFPTVTGSFEVTLSATNAGGTGTATLFLTITPDASVPAPTITSALAGSERAGQAFTYQISATGNPTSYAAGGLPTGLSVDMANGLITGIPSVAGTFNVVVLARNAGGTGTANLVLTIIPADTPFAPVITSTTSASGQAGQAFTFQIVASNVPTSYTATPLPNGLSVDSATGVISGTPATAGTCSISLSATNAGGTGTATLLLTVAPALPVVSLMATTPTVMAGSGDLGVFTLSLSATQDHDVFVAFTIKGTAVNGSDYVLLKTTKKIKAGKTSKPIKITPLGSGADTGVKRTVVLTLQPGDGYTVGTTGKIKVKIIGE